MTTATMPRPDGIEVVRDAARAGALLDRDRRRMLHALTEEPDSASGLARRLGDTRQRVNYHLRQLKEAGLVELHEERRRGNCYERVVRPIAQRFVVDPVVFGALAAQPGDVGDRFSATYVLALAARMVRELAAVLARATGQGKRLATVSIETEVRLAHPDSFQSMTRELSEAIARVVAKYHDEGASSARSFRLIAAVYPRPIDTDLAESGGDG